MIGTMFFIESKESIKRFSDDTSCLTRLRSCCLKKKKSETNNHNVRDECLDQMKSELDIVNILKSIKKLKAGL